MLFAAQTPKMLEKSKNMGYNEVKIQFNKENMPMLKIAEDHNGKEISSDESNLKYIFEFK